ncbi:MAG: hypothetical protein M3367_15665 [Acidobacteriota bacterium]|nr:hypothetical protein [Acidobacteriota bacterium]
MLKKNSSWHHHSVRPRGKKTVASDNVFRAWAKAGRRAAHQSERPRGWFANPLAERRIAAKRALHKLPARSVYLTTRPPFFNRKAAALARFVQSLRESLSFLG